MTQTQMTTIQIATFGSEGQEAIAAGIRNFPVHKLALICYESNKDKADDFSNEIMARRWLALSLETKVIPADTPASDSNGFDVE